MTDENQKRIAMLAEAWASVESVSAGYLEKILRSREATELRRKMFRALDAFGATEKNALAVIKFLKPRGLSDILATLKVEAGWDEKARTNKAVSLITDYRLATSQYTQNAILNELRLMTRGTKEHREAIRVAIRDDDHARLNKLLGIKLPE